MAINLNKTEKKSINLTKEEPSLTKVKGILWWKSEKKPYDLDISIFILKNTEDGPKLISDDHLVFYNNDKSPDGSVVKSKDERSGGTEEFTVDLSTITPEADELSLVVTIHKAQELGLSFGQIDEAGFKIIDEVSGKELAFFDLDEQFKNETAVQLGSFYKDGKNFTFQGVGAGFVLELGDFVQGYQ